MTKSASPSRVEAVKVGKRWQAISRQIQKRGTVLCRSANRFFSQLRFSLSLALSALSLPHEILLYIFLARSSPQCGVFCLFISFISPSQLPCLSPLCRLRGFSLFPLRLPPLTSAPLTCLLSACLDLPLLRIPVSSPPALTYLFSTYLSPLCLP